MKTLIHYLRERKKRFLTLIELSTINNRCHFFSTEAQRQVLESSDKNPATDFRSLGGVETDQLHVVTFSPEALGIGARDDVEGVHVAVHAHGDAFLKE